MRQGKKNANYFGWLDIIGPQYVHNPTETSAHKTATSRRTGYSLDEHAHGNEADRKETGIADVIFVSAT
jgi:hypothetical protein